MPEPYGGDDRRQAAFRSVEARALEAAGDRNRNADAYWMGEALRLAEASIGLASPNPRVGCVLVRAGALVGRGAHHYDRKDHAEVVALREAGGQAREATAYVTLEPCAHTGRTPPCAEALVKAGVSRVVVATGDPNPLVAGRGLAILRGAGIAVSVDTLAAPCRAINDGFARWIQAKLPFVTFKAGVSLDGRIAPPAALRQPGSVNYLTGARSLLAVQKLRHGSDAVLTGIGTVLADNPLLTDRSGGPRRRALLRVVLDSELRLPLGSRVLQTAQNDLLVFTRQDTRQDTQQNNGPGTRQQNGQSTAGHAHRERRLALEAAGARVHAVSSLPGGGLDLPAVLRVLAESYGVLNLLTEGGSALNRALLDSDAPLADKLCLFYAPMFLGDAGVPLIAGSLSQPIELQRSVLGESGSDFRLEAYLRDPWRES